MSVEVYKYKKNLIKKMDLSQFQNQRLIQETINPQG